jgi:hypothetical protein
MTLISIGMSIKNNEFDVRLLIGQIQKQVFSIIFDYVLNIEIRHSFVHVPDNDLDFDLFFKFNYFVNLFEIDFMIF